MVEKNSEINLEQEIILANQIYDKRAGSIKQNIVSKIGVKFSRRQNTENEGKKLTFYQNAHREILKSWKVRKLFNLGLAEWLPDHGVAKVLKHGKFIQTKGHLHKTGFVALYPEEALFLLDVGDLELTYKNALISLEDAYNLLLCQNPEDQLCTLDEYHVYSHLSKVGYRVQRYNHMNESSNLISEKQSISGAPQIKKIKLNHGDEKNEIKNIPKNTNINDLDYRDWWLKSLVSKASKTSSFEKNYVFNRVHIPNVFCKEEKVFLIDLEKCLFPSNTVSTRMGTLNLWNMKINRCNSDTIETKLSRNDFSHPKTLDYSKICHEAKNWAHFSELEKKAGNELSLEMERLSKQMNGGNIKPLITPHDAHNIDSLLGSLQYTGLDYRSNVQCLLEKDTHFKIKFNVFQSDTVKSFRKTQPGVPLLRIVVCNSLSSYPTACDTTLLNRQSNDVPVKFAVVTFGRVLFFGFSEIDIPVLIN